jgi:hypothetical protein
VAIPNNAEMSIDDLHLWPDNYNQGDVQAIARSILRFGMNGVLRVWQDNTVIAGNHTLRALLLLKDLGPDKALVELGFAEDKDPATLADELDWFCWPPQHVAAEGDTWTVAMVDVSHLNQQEATAFAIADNETARLSRPDDGKLAALLQQVQGTVSATAMGLSEEQVAHLLQQASTTTNDRPDEEPERTYEEGDTGVTVGMYRFTIPRDRYLAWLDELRIDAGFTTPEIVDELKRRLGV